MKVIFQFGRQPKSSLANSFSPHTPHSSTTKCIASLQSIPMRVHGSPAALLHHRKLVRLLTARGLVAERVPFESPHLNGALKSGGLLDPTPWTLSRVAIWAQMNGMLIPLANSSVPPPSSCKVREPIIFSRPADLSIFLRYSSRPISAHGASRGW